MFALLYFPSRIHLIIILIFYIVIVLDVIPSSPCPETYLTDRGTSGRHAATEDALYDVRLGRWNGLWTGCGYAARAARCRTRQQRGRPQRCPWRIARCTAAGNEPGNKLAVVGGRRWTASPSAARAAQSPFAQRRRR